MNSCFASKLDMAVTCRNEAWVRRLLSEGHDPNVTGAGEWSLLQRAIARGEPTIAKLLRDGGADGPDSICYHNSEEGRGIVFSLSDCGKRIERRDYEVYRAEGPISGLLG